MDARFNACARSPQLCSSFIRPAFALLKSSGTVVAWGNPDSWLHLTGMIFDKLVCWDGLEYVGALARFSPQEITWLFNPQSLIHKNIYKHFICAFYFKEPWMPKLTDRNRDDHGDPLDNLKTKRHFEKRQRVDDTGCFRGM